MKKIAIIHGEPYSINSEIIYKSWLKYKSNNKKKIFIIGSKRILEAQFRKLKINVKLHQLNNDLILKKERINILDIDINFKNPFILNLNEKKNYIFKSINKAHELAIKKKIKGFINCPINKEIFKKNIGVTEYMASKNKSRSKEVMLIYNKLFSVSPITTHINIKDVIKKLKSQIIIKKVNTISKFYSQKFKKKVKIGILGLNPHNDEMRTNSFEKKVLIPLIKKLKKRGLKIKGPLSVDNVFLKDKIEYDVVVGMYHDQVLGPFKAINKFNGINVTLGLKYLRVSPDHGTADDLIFKKRANANSLINCINFF